MPIDFNYITAFLQRMENAPPTFAPSCKGYVPMRRGVPIGASGITIGTGIDLGQQSAKTLIDMGIPASLRGQLTPYLGLKKMAATNKLKALPLVLSSDVLSAPFLITKYNNNFLLQRKFGASATSKIFTVNIEYKLKF